MWRFSLIYIAALCISAQALVTSPPRIIKQPPSEEMLFQVAAPGETIKPFLIECEAEGEPAPKYRWIKNGKPFEWQVYDNRMLQQPGRGTLVIQTPAEEDLGQYQCFAENEYGTATSNSVFVRKAELNSFKDEQPKTLPVDEGSPFKLKCQPPDGWPRPNVYWMIQNIDGGIKSINNSRMTLDPEGNLWFSNVTRGDASDEFYYACAASSVFRNEYKLGNRVLLEVLQTSHSSKSNKHAPERQYVSRKNEVALRGKKIELFCIYGGTPLPQIVWTKNGQQIHWNEHVTLGNYGKSLIIKRTTFEDKGTYTCEASNGVGSADTYSIKLDIRSIPYFTKEPENYIGAEDEDAEFVCEAAGVPEPEIKWIYNGKPIEQAPYNARRTVGSKKISISKLEKKDIGNYGCNATNALGYVYKDVYLNVLAEAPTIVEPPRQEATVVGQDITMKCRSFGSPKPKVKWIKNGLEMTGGRYKTLPSGDLEITSVAFADAGDFTCHSENKLGSINASGSLIVKEQTKISLGPADYEVAAGQSATFRCDAVADASLDLEIEWLNKGEVIDFENQPRFVLTNDNSLTISKTIELDSSTYTCVAKTELDKAEASATLIVQDVPNKPDLLSTACEKTLAQISWNPMGDNRAPILNYIIQYNTSFNPDTWIVYNDNVPSTDHNYAIQLSPWSNYTFRVIAKNKIGPSDASDHGEMCSTESDVPYKNPENVKGEGSNPSNMVISWTPMAEIDHNGPRFQYRVSWRRDIASEWNNEDIFDWQQSSIEVRDLPTFQKYLIKVVAINEKGEANVAASEVIGYSGEDRPTDAPKNLTLLQITSPTNAILSWEPVANESVRGHLKGYKIQHWTEQEGEQNFREILQKYDSNKALVSNFVPDSINFARILVYNGRFNGPPSNVVSFQTPEGTPSSIQGLEVYPLGKSAFLLKWKKPLQANGKLNGYRIYYSQINGTEAGTRVERLPQINSPNITEAKLAGMKENTKYRIHVTATTKAGEGEDFFVERTTTSEGTAMPDMPDFYYEALPTEDNLANVRFKWLPNLQGNPGSHFFVQRRVKGEPLWINSEPELEEDFCIVRGLDPETAYEFRVVSVDGDQHAESLIKEIYTSGLDGPIIIPNQPVASAGWFIGMMLAIAFLILLLIIICIIKRNRGGKYDVHDRELANGRHDYPEDSGFPEYSQPLDNKSQGRQSLSSQKVGPESDTDSMAEYGEGDTGGQFTEDGSFIGQYVPGKPVSAQSTPQNPSLQGGATYV